MKMFKKLLTNNYSCFDNLIYSLFIHRHFFYSKISIDWQVYFDIQQVFQYLQTIRIC